MSDGFSTTLQSQLAIAICKLGVFKPFEYFYDFRLPKVSFFSKIWVTFSTIYRFKRFLICFQLL